jgi:hypothetical protein
MRTDCTCGFKIYHDDNAPTVRCGQCGKVDTQPPQSRVDRIKQNVERDKRLREWVAFFRIAGERGLGDTVHRLRSLAKSKQLQDDLRKIERFCSCETSVAIARLNEQWPY